MNKTKGAFGGHYNWQVIKELRNQLAMKSIMLAALVKHTGIGQQELERVTTQYMKDSEAELQKHHKNS